MTTAERSLLRSSGEPRPRASRRTDAVMAVLSAWIVVGLLLDAWAHANVPQLETFFTPWHAVFYSGFAATAGFVLWTVNRYVEQGRRGLAAVPLGYAATMVALPVFVVSGTADMAWHTFLGIEKTTDIFFSPSHLGLLASGIVILTSPLRSAWTAADARAPWPAVATLAFAATMTLLFLNYGNALTFNPQSIVAAFSDPTGRASGLAVRMAVTTLVLVAPLLLLARRWTPPFGAATVCFAVAALLSTLLAGFRNLPTVAAVVVAGLLVDVLALRLRPTAARRTAYWAFGAAAPLATWTLYLGVAMVAEGRVPAVVALWTGAPLVGALLGCALAVLMLPTAAEQTVGGAG